MTAPIWLKGYDEGVPTTLEPYPDRTLLDYLSESAQKWPDRPFLLFKGSKITYAQVEKESNALAAALVAIGVKPDDRVALCLPNSPQFLIAEFAGRVLQRDPSFYLPMFIIAGLIYLVALGVIHLLAPRLERVNLAV